MENKWYSNITSYEEKGRNVVTTSIDHILSGVKVVYNTEIQDNIDLIADVDYAGQNNKIGIEIKCYNQLYTYMGTKDKQIEPSVILKKEKLDRMKNYCSEHSIKYILYIIVYKNYLFIYNINNIKWDDTPSCFLHQKKTQMNPDSPIVEKLTYFIPLKKATKIVKWQQ